MSVCDTRNEDDALPLYFVWVKGVHPVTKDPMPRPQIWWDYLVPNLKMHPNGHVLQVHKLTELQRFLSIRDLAVALPYDMEKDTWVTALK